ncbi:MAG: N-acetylglucosamine-6-phosphate deacetylase [Rhizobiaceae bacterium]
MTTRYIKADKIFDGELIHKDCALVVVNNRIQAIVFNKDIPETSNTEAFSGGFIAPGFVDVQVNGGGGVMLNDDQSVDAIQTICAAHRKFGTTSVLPTLITDTPARTQAAIDAAIKAHDQGTAGFAGLHLEGPHLSIKRQGAHDPALIRTMNSDDLAMLLDAKAKLPTLLTTIAPESVTLEQVSTMAKAGIIVSLGHTDCSFETAQQYFAAGATMVTHLFNAMSQLTNREPGLVGAALNTTGVSCGLIADGFHAHAASMQVAARTKMRPGNIFLVTDAMSTVGSDIQSFKLNGRTILREAGRLTLTDGTLAGADIDMISCVTNARNVIDLDPKEAIRMASLYPATAINRQSDIGSLKPGARADFIHLSDDLELLSVHLA